MPWPARRCARAERRTRASGQVSRTKDKFAFLLQQTEIFAHFLSGTKDSKDDGKR